MQAQRDGEEHQFALSAIGSEILQKVSLRRSQGEWSEFSHFGLTLSRIQ